MQLLFLFFPPMNKQYPCGCKTHRMRICARDCLITDARKIGEIQRKDFDNKLPQWFEQNRLKQNSEVRFSDIPESNKKITNK